MFKDSPSMKLVPLKPRLTYLSSPLFIELNSHQLNISARAVATIVAAEGYR